VQLSSTTAVTTASLGYPTISGPQRGSPTMCANPLHAPFQNRHEQMTFALMGLLAGAPHVFVPDKYRRGKSGIREFADLVWFCDDVLILFHLSKSIHEADLHNQKQLRGSIRAWRELSHSITGRNRWKQFCIPYSDGIRAASISVVTAPDDTMRVDSRLASDLKISLCATVSTQNLVRISNSHYSMLDLLQMLLAPESTASVHLRDQPLLKSGFQERVDRLCPGLPLVSLRPRDDYVLSWFDRLGHLRVAVPDQHPQESLDGIFAGPSCILPHQIEIASIMAQLTSNSIFTLAIVGADFSEAIERNLFALRWFRLETSVGSIDIMWDRTMGWHASYFVEFLARIRSSGIYPIISFSRHWEGTQDFDIATIPSPMHWNARPIWRLLDRNP